MKNRQRGFGKNLTFILRGAFVVLSFSSLALAFSLSGCAQTPTFLKEDGAAYKHHEQMIMVPEPSGQSTNQSLHMDMEGGG